MLLKNVTNKKCALKFVIQNKKDQKDLDDFSCKEIDFYARLITYSTRIEVRNFRRTLFTIF